MIGRIYAIMLNTFREAVRDRVLYAVVLIASLVLIGTLALAQLSLDQEARVVHDLGLAAISLFAVIVAIFLGSSLLYKEMERKTLYVILPKPIHRWEFLVGKFAGIVLTGTVFVTLIGAVFLAVVGSQAGGSLLTVAIGAVVAAGVLGVAVWKAPDPTVVVVPWSLLVLGASVAFASAAGQSVSPLLGAFVLCVCEVAVVTGVAVFFSSFSTPFVTGMLTVGVWLVGRSADTLQTIESRMLTEEIIALLRVTAEVVPNFVLFVPGGRLLNEADSWGYVAQTCAYAALYCAILMVLSSLVFRRRDLP